jgi:transposase
MKQFTPEQKHEILLDYTPHSASHSFAALAARHAVAGGRDVVRRWHDRWDGTAVSLQHKAVSGRPHALTLTEVTRHIVPPIRRANRAARSVRYTSVAEQVRQKTGKAVSDRTVQRIGKEQLGARKTRGKKRTSEESECTHTRERVGEWVCSVLCADELVCSACAFSVSADMCEQIAQVRRKLQRIGTQHILFLDETHKREGDVQNYSIVLPGEPPFIESSSTSKYAARFDMIACCSGHTVLPPIIYSAKERDRGVTQEMLLQYICDLLAQSAGALDTYPLLLVLDRAPIHNEENIMQEFHDWGCQELTQVIRLPPASAKRLSPLDNSLFNLWRQRVLADGGLTKANIKTRMSNAWNSITKADIQAQYKHCGLMRHHDVYLDCPNPAAHRHGS